MPLDPPATSTVLPVKSSGLRMPQTRSMMIAGAMPPAAHIVTSPPAQVTALELVEQRADEDRSRRADRVPERDRAPVHVDLLAIEAQVADELLGHDGEGLVDLEEVDVVDGQARLLEHLARGGHRRVEHERRTVADIGGGNH